MDGVDITSATPEKVVQTLLDLMKLLKTALKEAVSKGRPPTVITTLLCQLQAQKWFHWIFVF